MNLQSESTKNETGRYSKVRVGQKGMKVDGPQKNESEWSQNAWAVKKVHFPPDS